MPTSSPSCPRFDDFIGSLGDLFEWLGGHELARLEPVPPVRSVTTDDIWVAPPTMTRWPGGVPLEQIRFAGANHLLVDRRYQGTSRLIEPYALRRSQAGNLLVYAIKAGVEVRAPWREDYGPEWTRGGVARLRYVAKHKHWVLYWRDRNQKWHKYDLLGPSPDVLVLLDEIDRDPTGIFCG